MMRKFVVPAALMVLFVALWTHSALPQAGDDQNALKKEIEKLKEGQAAIQKELEDIKNQLRARPTAAAPAQEAVVNIDGAPFKGQKTAKVTLVDFTDYQ